MKKKRHNKVQIMMNDDEVEILDDLIKIVNEKTSLQLNRSSLVRTLLFLAYKKGGNCLL